MQSNKRYLFVSFFLHAILAIVILCNFNFGTPRYVLENTKNTDVINVVILGDTEKSKVMPKPLPQVIPEQKVVANKPTPPVIIPKPTRKEIIAIKPPNKTPIVLKPLTKKQEVVKKEIVDKIKTQQKIADELLADLKKKMPRKNQAKDKNKELNDKFAKTLRTQTEKSLREHLLEEEIRLHAEQERKTQGIINKYSALIQQAISEHWIVPDQSNRKLYCELLIQLSPSGSVLEVTVKRTSGDRALDNSARAAVLKASPLPVPKDPKEAALFKEFVLKVKPENVLGYKNQAHKKILA